MKIIIPSWSRLPPDIEAETGSRYAALIRLGGVPIYKHIVNMNYFNSTDNEFKIIFPNENFQKTLQIIHGKNIEFIHVNQSNSIAMTVLAGLKDICSEDSVTINMGDTIIELEKDIEFDCIYTDYREDLYRWTNVLKGSTGSIEFPNDRNYQDFIDIPQEVCVGLFCFSDGQRFKKCLESALISPEVDHDPFFTAISEYSKDISMELRPVLRWLDCGHVDTYYETRLNFQNLRHFNRLNYDPVKGQVTKTSENSDQFRHQVRWFKQVPDSLNAFLPRIFDSTDGENPFITMELLTIPTLSDAFITKRISLGAWNGVVRNIKHILDEMSMYVYETDLSEVIAKSVYVDKTRNRILEFISKTPESVNYFVRTNGRLINLNIVLDELEIFVKNSGLLNIHKLIPIHGDFCFSNLLYDPKAKLVKMIDPRGEFGIPGIYGDNRYDLAKLTHSFSGGYDFIITDAFELNVNTNSEIQFFISTDEYHLKVKEIFEKILLDNDLLYKQVKAIEALLFLSMIPLHSDFPKRQLAMLATGLRLFDESIIILEKK